jgi:hypothetical protein
MFTVVLGYIIAPLVNTLPLAYHTKSPCQYLARGATIYPKTTVRWVWAGPQASSRQKKQLD